MIGFDNFGVQEDIILDPLGLEYLDVMVFIDDYFGCTIEDGLKLFEYITDIGAQYTRFKDENFLEYAYDKLMITEEEIDNLIRIYNITPKILLMMFKQDPNLSYFDFISLLTHNNESFIFSSDKAIITFFRRFNKSYKYICNFFDGIKDVDIEDYLYECSVIIDNNLDYRNLNTLKSQVKQKTKDTFMLFENKNKIEGYSNVLTPVYILKDGTITHLDIELEHTKINLTPDNKDLKYNEIYNDSFLKSLEDKFIEIEQSIVQADESDKKFLYNSFLGSVYQQLSNFSFNRIDEIKDNITFCMVNSINKQIGLNETIDTITHKLNKLQQKIICGLCTTPVQDEMLKIKKNLNPSDPYNQRNISQYLLNNIQSLQDCLKDILPDLPDDSVYLNIKENPCYQQEG